MNLKPRMRRLNWLTWGWLFRRGMALQNLGRVAIESKWGEYTRTACQHCDSRLYSLGILQTLPVPTTARGIPPRVEVAWLAEFCIRCGSAEKLALNKDRHALLTAALGPLDQTFNILDVVERLERENGSERFRQEAVAQEIRVHAEAIARLRRARPLAAGPYRSMATVCHFCTPDCGGVLHDPEGDRRGARPTSWGDVFP